MSHRLLFHITGILLTLSAWIETPAQTVQFISNEELSNSAITSICQDVSGSIWIGSNSGLHQFDGNRFTHYTHRENDSTSLMHNCVNKIFLDRQDNLWIGTNIGLQLYSHDSDSFTHYQIFDGKSRVRISDIVQLSDDRIIIGTAGYGLQLINAQSNNLIWLDAYQKDIQDSYFDCLYEDSSGNLWKCATHTFSRISKEGDVIEFRREEGVPVGIFELDKQLYLVFRNHILLYDNGDLRKSDIKFDQHIAGFTTVLNDCNENIYIGTSGNGLYQICSGSKTMKPYPVKVDGINMDALHIEALFEDYQGNIWAGCQKQGLLVIHKDISIFNSWKFSSNVKSICNGDNGIIWCSFPERGIYAFDKQGKVTSSTQSPEGINLIYKDSSQEYWLCSDRKLYTYNPESGSSEAIKEIARGRFNFIVDDRNGHLILSIYSEGLLIYEIAKKRFRSFSMHDISAETHGHLCNDWINSMLTDSKGLIWIGTVSGVSCLDIAHNSFKPFEWHALLDGMACHSLCETDDGNIIIGTEQGIFIWNRNSNHLEQLDCPESLNQTKISHIVQDANGDLWFLSSNGIWHHDSDSDIWKNHVGSTWMTTHEEVKGNVGLKTEDGRIVFISNGGITSFHPDHLKTKSSARGIRQYEICQIAEPLAACNQNISTYVLFAAIIITFITCILIFFNKKTHNHKARGNITIVQQAIGTIESPDCQNPDEKLKERIVRSIRSHLSDSDFTIDILCHEVGISRAHLHRKMKEMTGFTASEFIRTMRMEHSVCLMKEKKLNITHIAYAVGYSSLSHFSTAFRKHFGTSPTDFMERLQ